MITEHKRNCLKEMAEQIAALYQVGQVTALHNIAASEEITICYDHYEDTFDGLLVYEEEQDQWYIHINLDRGNSENSFRGRFSLAHELAHYFIDEHRIGIKSGAIAPIGSRNDLSPQNEMEEEADYFASCLLMPDNLFRAVRTPKKFSLDTVLQLSAVFQVSVLSTAIKFAEIGTHEICAVLSENGEVRWSARSKDFPKWANRFKRGQKLPLRTVAAEFFSDSGKRYTGIEPVTPNDWFEATYNADRDMYEQCYYSDSYGYVLSVLWFD